MLGFFFGFHARLGRLQYFLTCLAMAAVLTLFCFAIALSAFRHTPPGQSPESLLTLPVLCIIPVACWMTVTLQSMRIRDIGWNPAYVIPVWLLVISIDMVVAIAFPGLAVGKEHTETMFGALVNLGLTLVLLFWPSGSVSAHSAAPDFNEMPQARFSPAAQVAAPTAPRHQAVPKKTGFGRRGV